MRRSARRGVEILFSGCQRSREGGREYEEMGLMAGETYDMLGEHKHMS